MTRLHHLFADIIKTWAARFKVHRQPRIGRHQINTLIEQAYMLVLGREPDSKGREHYLQQIMKGHMGIEAIIPDLQNSEEYTRIGHTGNIRTDPEVRPFLTPDVASFSARLQEHGHINREDFEHLWRQVFQDGPELVIGQKDYAPTHKERFWELFNAVALLLDKVPKPRLLEFGVSEYSRFYRQLFPHLTLDTADRPVDPHYPGFTPARCMQISGCQHHYSVDLTRPQTLVSTIPNRYDLIVFAEVLEHLVVNPVELFAHLLSLLSPDGSIYLTTPNFFSRHHLDQIRNRENPQEVFPPGHGNWDAHFHHREYGLKELLRFVDQAGGKTTGWYFSDCWDRQGSLSRTQNRIQECERGNIVLTFGRNPAPTATPRIEPHT